MLFRFYQRHRVTVIEFNALGFIGITILFAALGYLALRIP
jgi:hypothetical protein